MAIEKGFLVTGAGGFIGGWLVETLHLSGYANVYAGIRRWSSGARLGRLPVKAVLCDVMDEQQISQAMAGAACVIHCAVGDRHVIVQGTRNVLASALKLKVERFVHLSTTEVYGNARGEIDETFPCQYTGDPYGDSKIEAERLCWEHYEKGLPVTVIRPSIVYGPFGKDWTVGIAHKLRSGNWGLFKGYGEGICNLVYVADLVCGILLATHHKRAVGEAFNLSGPETITWNEYFRRFNAALGFAELNVVGPSSSKARATIVDPTRAAIKFALGHIEDPVKKAYQRSGKARHLMQRVESRIRTTPRLAELKLYSRDARYLTSKAQDMLGYRPRFEIDRGLAMTVRWIVHQGLLL